MWQFKIKVCQLGSYFLKTNVSQSSVQKRQIMTSSSNVRFIKCTLLVKAVQEDAKLLVGSLLVESQAFQGHQQLLT